MPLRNILKKKDKTAASTSAGASTGTTNPSATTSHQVHNAATTSQKQVPEFIFLRTTTNLQETIQPPSFPGDLPPAAAAPILGTHTKEPLRTPSHSLFFHFTPKSERKKPSPPPPSPRRLSDRLEKLGIGRARSASNQ